MSTQRKGFTLLELIVAMAIVTVLAGLVVPLAKNAIEDAKIAKTVAFINTLKKAANKYWYDTGLIPVESIDSGTHDLFVNNVGASWKGPYIDHPLGPSDNPWYQSFSIVGAHGLNKELNGFGNGYRIGGIVIPVNTPGSEFILPNLPRGLGAKFDLAFDSKAGATDGVCEFTMAVTGDTVRVFLFEKK